MFALRIEKRMFPVISTIVSKQKDFSMLQAVTYAAKVVIYLGNVAK